MAGPAAIAPQPGGGELIGEVSAAAQGAGVYPGMRLGEALARCPTLALVPGDPVGVAEQWELVLAALEGIGAAVESGDPGLACFDARGLRRLHGGSLDGVFNATRVALRRPARLGAGPSRFCALAGAHRARARHPEIVRGAPDLAGDSVDLLRSREQTAHLPPDLQRLGIATLGQLAALPRDCPRRPLRQARHPRPRPRPRPRRAAAPARAERAPRRTSRAAGGQLGAAAPARARRPDRPAARPPRAARAHGAQRRAGGGAGRGRHVARAGRVPRGDRRRGADAPRARAVTSTRCPRPPRRWR